MMRKLAIMLSIISIFLVSSVIVRAAFPAQVSVNITSSFDRTNKNMTHTTVNVDWNTNLNLDGATIHPSYAFQYWILNGTVNEDLPASLNMKVKTSMNLHAVFSKTGEHAVLFIDSNGKLISLQYVSDAQTVTAPSYDGYTKPGQTVNESTPWKTLSGNSSLENITSSRVYVLQYETNVQLVTITLVNATVSSIEKNINQVVTVTADDLVDFEYWKNADNEVISYSPSFSFTATKNITLTAEMLDDSKTPANLVTISQDLEIRTGYNTYVGRFELLEGQTIHEFGFLVSKTDEDVDFDSSDLQIVKSNAYNQSTNEFIMSFSIGSYMSVKSYIIVDNGGALSSVISSSNRTTEQTSVTKSLIISEYIEGSSENKAIELYNGTGSSIDLGLYNLVQYNNGSPTISYILALSGTLANGSTYVISKSNAALLGITSKTNLPSTSNVMGFNGNDAIAITLKSNNSIIDIIGVPGNAANFAIDQTLVRKSNVIEGVTSYVAGQWDTYSTDNTDNLGSHTVVLGTVLSESEKSLLDMEAISLPTTKKDTTSLTLSPTGANGSTITWTSDSPLIISNTGVVSLPSGQPETVILTARIINGASVRIKEFEVLVGLTDEDKATVDFAQIELLSQTSTLIDLNLPISGETYYTAFTWSSSNLTYITNAGIVIKLPDSGSVDVILTVIANENEDIFEEFVIKVNAAAVQSEVILYNLDFTNSPDLGGFTGTTYMKKFDISVRDIVSSTNIPVDFSNAMKATFGGLLDTRLFFASQVKTSYGFDETLDGTGNSASAAGAGGLRFQVISKTYTKVEFRFTYDNRTSNQNSSSNIDLAQVQYWDGDSWEIAKDFLSTAQTIVSGDQTLTIVFTTPVLTTAFRVLFDETNTTNNGQLIQPTTLKLYGYSGE